MTQGTLTSTFSANNGVHRHPHKLTDGELPDPHCYFGVHSASAPSRAGTSVPWQGAISVKEEAAFQVHEANHSDLCFVIFSDLHLDHPKTMSAFATVLQGYVDADFIPFALVLCGNFASQQYSSADMIDMYKGK